MEKSATCKTGGFGPAIESWTKIIPPSFGRDKPISRRTRNTYPKASSFSLAWSCSRLGMFFGLVRKFASASKRLGAIVRGAGGTRLNQLDRPFRGPPLERGTAGHLQRGGSRPLAGLPYFAPIPTLPSLLGVELATSGGGGAVQRCVKRQWQLAAAGVHLEVRVLA